MKREELVKAVISVIQKKTEQENITEDMSMSNDLGFDSLDLIDLTMRLEKEFDIGISDEEFNEIFRNGSDTSIKDIVNYLENKLLY